MPGIETVVRFPQLTFTKLKKPQTDDLAKTTSYIEVLYLVNTIN